MLIGDGNENGKKGLISKKPILHLQHPFLYISLPLLCTTSVWNFLVPLFMKEMPCVFMMFPFFLTADHFGPGGRQLFSFFHRHNKIRLLCFISPPSSLSLIHVSVDI